ncbi:M23 family metallopeptidase [Zongyangia hominis]|uniref:M23 family metallopeptidase n=1 Tax=Zongyangia hominis TaxID=2763677 RepID=A0A926I6T6_9FIRM|nr:M23 family metallopeptidase [Zongyangia hominis]MBC8570389.1 M23 family metallopeptidase [Zongyangia hominis]
MLPLSGDVINKYSAGELVKNQTLGDWRTHDGIDMAAASGTPVKAVADGVVETVSDDPLWGKTVTISHSGGYSSCYSGLSDDVSLKDGQTVEIGQLVGYVGSSPLSEVALESHLHFGLKLDGQWVDPLVTMDKLQD